MSHKRVHVNNRLAARPQSAKVRALESLFAEGIRAHQAGRLEEAKSIYLQVLQKDVKHADGLHALGLLVFQLGGREASANMIRRAIAADASKAEYYSSLGAVLRESGRLGEALTAYQKTLSIKPQDEVAHFSIATIFRLRGEWEQSRFHYERAFELRSDRPDTQNNLGIVLQSQGKIEEARACYELALRIDSNFAPAYANLGTILFNACKFEEAHDSFQRALEISPDFAEALNGLGTSLLELGKLDEAIVCHERALALKPDDAGMWSNLGNVLRRQGKLEEAKEKYDRALKINPGLAVAHSNIGNVLQYLGKLDQARLHFYKALVIQPQYVDAQWNLGLLDLMEGDFNAGWKGMEARQHRRKIAPRQFKQPQWKGEALEGRTILLHCEQGLGDTIQFLRYVPIVQQLGGKVVLNVPRELERIAREMPGLAALTVRGESLPGFDLHCPFMSMPLAFRTNLTSIPCQAPYLTVPQEALQSAKTLLGNDDGRLRVGISWSGNPKHREDHARSIPFDLLLPFLNEDRVRIYSLQIDQASLPLASVESSITELKHAIHDFADTAAIMTQLDLIISVDTSVAHLAGALGRPTWALIPFAPDWRWLLERTDSPWYPSMRLFRQPAIRDWKSVLNRVYSELIQLAEEKERMHS